MSARRLLALMALVCLLCLSGCTVTASWSRQFSGPSRQDYEAALDRLCVQLGPLEQYAAAEDLQPAVVKKAILDAEGDISLLDDNRARQTLDQTSSAEADKACAMAREYIRAIRARLGRTSQLARG